MTESVSKPASRPKKKRKRKEPFPIMNIISDQGEVRIVGLAKNKNGAIIVKIEIEGQHGMD